MRHYYANKNTYNHKRKIVDTLDLSTEYFVFEDFAHLYTDSFINAFYTNVDISKNFVKGRRNKQLQELAFEYFEWSEVHTRDIEFPIKDGYVKYDHEDIIVEVFGEVHKFHMIPQHYKNIRDFIAGKNSKDVYFIFDDSVLYNIAVPKNTEDLFYVSDINVIDTILAIQFKPARTSDNNSLNYVIEIKINYKTRFVTVNYLSCGFVYYQKPINEYLLGLESELKSRIKIGDSSYKIEPNQTINLLREAYTHESTDKRVVDSIMAHYAKAITSDVIYYDDFTKVLISDYKKRFNIKENDRTLMTKLMFLCGVD